MIKLFQEKFKDFQIQMGVDPLTKQQDNPAENINFHICRFSKSSFSYKNSIFANKVGFVVVFIHLMLDDEW